MASFIPPKIQDNPSGWGPNDPPEQFKDLPYAPFSKGDRLGKVRKISCFMSYCQTLVRQRTADGCFCGSSLVCLQHLPCP